MEPNFLFYYQNQTKNMNRTKSEQLYAEALKLMPGGVNSPVRAFRSVGGTPIFFDKGESCYVTDVDGNTYIDYCCSWGPLILGHVHPHVKKAIYEAVEKGSSFGAPTEAENKLASLIIRNIPFIEKIRFVSSGTEAVMSAIRLARGYTKKNKVIKFDGCFHGHVDSMLVKAGSGLVTFGISSSAGVPQSYASETIVLPLNNIELLHKTFEENADDIAAVIIEPVPANNGLLLQDKVFLTELRKVCTQYHSMLIFDEVISGFRVGFSGASGHYGITPDIVTYGKIIGGGMPVGAYASSAKIMSMVAPEGPVYQAGTLSGNPVAMAAGYAQLNECLQPGFYESLENKTKFLVDALNGFISKNHIPVRVFNIASIFWISFSDKNRIIASDEIDGDKMKYFNQFHALLLEKGVYLGPSGYEVGFVSSEHTMEVLQTTADKMCDALSKIYLS